MLAGIKNILIVVNKGQLSQFSKLLQNGNRLGIKLATLNKSDQEDYLTHLSLVKNLSEKIKWQ